MRERYVKATVIERGEYRSGMIINLGTQERVTFADLFPVGIKGGMGRPSAPICRFHVVVEAVVIERKTAVPGQLSLEDERLLKEGD